MIDARDIADVAVAELLRRDRASSAQEPVTLELIGPQPLTVKAVKLALEKTANSVKADNNSLD